MSQKRPPLSWQCDVPLVTHPVLLRSLAIMCGVSTFIMVALVGGLIALTEGIRSAVPMIGMGMMIGAGMFVLSLLIMLVVFRNRMTMQFEVGEDGASARVVDRRSRIANRLAMVAGTLAGRPGVAGAGMLAMNNEEVGTAWRGVASARYDPARFTITLRNDWRPVMHLFCTPETYQEAAARVADGLSRVRRPASRGAARNPLWAAMGWSVVVIVSVLPLFGMPYPFAPDLFAVILVLCFGLATVWLVPVMGWPVLAGIAWIAGTLVLQGLAPHTSRFSGDSFTGFGTLDAGEWIGFSITCAGLAVLAAVAVAALRGRLVSLLLSDMLKMEGRR